MIYQCELAIDIIMVVKLTVIGRVQGVWFRASTRDEALRLGLVGTVRNIANGGVEIIASGDEAQLERLIQWAHKGPLMAKVTDVRVEPLSSESLYSSFAVIH